MKRVFIPVMSALLATPLAYAADQPVVDPKPISGSAELGYIATSGNSDTNNLNGRLAITQESLKWRTDYSLSSLFSSADDDTTAEKYSGSVQSNYKFNTEEFWYVRGTYDRDRFGGYRHQSSVSTGYGNRFWQQADGSYLEASAGVGYRDYGIDRDIDPDGKSDRGSFVRLAATYENKLTANSLFRQDLTSEISTSGGSTVNESVSAVQANILNDLAMKLAYRIKHTSDVPADTEKTDTETTVSVLYSF